MARRVYIHQVMENTVSQSTVRGLGRFAFRTLSNNGKRSVTFKAMRQAFERDAARFGLQASTWALYNAGARDEQTEIA